MQPNTPARLALFPGTVLSFRPSMFHVFQGYRHGHLFAIAQNTEMDGRSRLRLPDANLQLSRVNHLIAINLGDYVANVKSCLSTGESASTWVTTAP